jgi:hypothetical protein
VKQNLISILDQYYILNKEAILCNHLTHIQRLKPSLPLPIYLLTYYKRIHASKNKNKKKQKQNTKNIKETHTKIKFIL